jgi:hypothetical protein
MLECDGFSSITVVASEYRGFLFASVGVPAYISRWEGLAASHVDTDKYARRAVRSPVDPGSHHVLLPSLIFIAIERGLGSSDHKDHNYVFRDLPICRRRYHGEIRH